MTYSPDHVTADQHLADLLDTLISDVSELHHYLVIYGDVKDLPRLRPPADPDRTGRQATHAPSRPTEDAALCEARGALTEAVRHGVTRVAQACALVRGSTAEMDRALGEWEGPVLDRIVGDVRGHDHGAADDAGVPADAG